MMRRRWWWWWWVPPPCPHPYLLLLLLHEQGRRTGDGGAAEKPSLPAYHSPTPHSPLWRHPRVWRGGGAGLHSREWPGEGLGEGMAQTEEWLLLLPPQHLKPVQSHPLPVAQQQQQQR